MNQVLKRLASASAVVAVSVVASTATFYALNGGTRRGLSADMDLTVRDHSALAHGFQNSSMAISPQNRGFAPDLTDAAERSVQAVVHIKVEAERQSRPSMGGIDPFEFFFGGQGGMQSRMEPVVGYGSGVIISNNGYIMTNNHVVDGSSNINVTLDDKRTFPAKLIGTDPNTDIALLKIEAKDLPTIPFGDSDKLRLGEWVLAVGNPFNLTGTVTAGIVSAKSRTTPRSGGSGLSKVESFIQTDAAVNSGNSGGALVNAQGELVGINTMIYSQTGNYAGYSFAVPINMAAKVVEDIKKFGSVQRGLLGIVGLDVTPELVKQENLKVNKGVYIAEFAEISAALAAGIEKGDVITAINGQSIDDFGQLQGEIGRHRPGDTIAVTVDRRGTSKTVRVTLKNEEGGQGVIKETNTGSDALGAKLRAIDADKLRAYGLSYGVEVQAVSSGALRSAGIRAGYIILTANNSPVRSIADLNKAIASTRQAQQGGRRGQSNSSLYLRGFYPDSGEVVGYYVELK